MINDATIAHVSFLSQLLYFFFCDFPFLHLSLCLSNIFFPNIFSQLWHPCPLNLAHTLFWTIYLTPVSTSTDRSLRLSLPTLFHPSPQRQGPGWSVGSITQWRNTFTSSGAERQLSQMEQTELSHNSPKPIPPPSSSSIPIFSTFTLLLLLLSLHASCSTAIFFSPSHLSTPQSC